MIRLKQSNRLPDLGILLLLLLLPLLLYTPVALGTKTLLPVDNLFLFEPYREAAADLGVDYPHNHLVSDLILQNYAWKGFILESIRNDDLSLTDRLPLWDPYILAGHPFLANGQHSALYPLSIVFYVLPLWRAYGVFAWLQVGLAGVFTYIFARVLGIRRLGGMIAGITFQLSGFMVVSSVPHPMIIAAASWLPLILAMVELIIQQRPALSQRPATLPWALLGAAALGCQMLAGHAENTGIVLLVTGAYATWRLITNQLTSQPTRSFASWLVGWFVSSRRAMIWLTVLLVLGLALGAVQFIPYLEVVNTSFRGGDAAASLQDVLGWAYPKLRVIAFGIPHFFGNPAHHGYFDLFTWRWTPAPRFSNGQYIDWGIKNYVEGGAYLGLLPLFLAVIAVISQFTSYQSTSLPGKRHIGRRVIGKLVNWFKHPLIPFFTLLAIFSLGCVFGTPLYALIYSLPSFDQSHSPFRWIFPLTLCVATLAGFGIDAATKSRERQLKQTREKKQSLIAKLFLLNSSFSLTTLLAGLAFWGGAGTLVALVASRLFFPQVEPVVESIFHFFASRREKFSAAFPNHLAFYSYEFPWVALFGLLLTATGIVLRVSRCPIYIRRRPVWEFLAVGVLVLDMVAWGAGFAPAADAALLDYVPAAVDFLQQDTTIWRYASFTPHGAKTMNANVGMLHGLQSVDGYDSLFTDQYRDYMALIEPQDETPYNRIASFHKGSSLYSPLTDLLNVKYVVTEAEIDSYKYELVYEDDAVRVYENLGVMARAFTLPASATVETDDFGAAVQSYDPRNYVIVEIANRSTERSRRSRKSQVANPATAVPQPVTSYTNNEVFVDATVSEPSWLVLADSYFQGWKAFVRPQGTGEESETEIQVHRVNGTFRGVQLEPGTWTVRFKYSPDSVKVGAFVSFIAGMAALFLIGLYLWRFFYREENDASTVKRVAKNSIAPIVLNLFIKAIDFAFGMLMARALGPVGVGRYVWAAQAYFWFAVIADFGLELYVIREVSRDRSRARSIFVNTTALRLLLLLGIVPAVGAFLGGWQALFSPLEPETTWTLVLLCVGLLPFTLANSLTAFFRAYEKHEFPAVAQTATAIVRVVLGAIALVGGLGIVGLAGTVILTNVATLIILAILARRHIWADTPHKPAEIVWPLQRKMLIESWPVTASILLQTLFPSINVLLLKPLQGDEVVGWYDAGYKWLNTLQIIPQFFIPAVFPVLSRQAAKDKAVLRQSYRLSTKLLLMLAIPAAILLTLLARFLVGFLSGPAFLPHGAIALQILIWSALFGWFNSLTNYVLIALDRQRQVMLASAARVAFTLATNLLFVSKFSYVASACIIIGGELLLAVLFYADLRRHLGAIGWGKLLWRVALAALLMGGVVWAVSTVSPALALLAGVIVYPVALLLLRALTPEERAALAPLLPEPLRRIIPA